MSGNQIPSLPGKKRRQMPGVCRGGDVEASIWLVHNFLGKETWNAFDRKTRKTAIIVDKNRTETKD